MKELSKRTATFTDSVIRRMTRISNKYGAVNLSQGFPDFEPPKEILERLAEVAKEDFHQYSITWGAQNFREALAKKQEHFMGRSIDPNSEIVVTCGRFMKITVRIQFCRAQNRFMFRFIRPNLISMQMNLKRHSNKTPKL